MPATPKSMDAVLARIQELEAQLATARQATVREVLQHLEVHASEFHFNAPNNYGYVCVSINTGKGNPWELYRGKERQQEYQRGGRRGSGYYRLNDAAVQMLVEQLDAAAERRATVTEAQA